jgi:hypothetical protein
MPRNRPVPKITRLPVADRQAREFEDLAEARGNGAEPARRKGTRWERRDGTSMRACTIHMPAELAKELRVRCAEQDRSMSETVVEAVSAWLQSSETA